ncbi:hypothetical protein GDO86_001492 [Hymenochirus boettgeri]|uniref:Peptidase M1 membrane alanine aminopeptidase domain-containing protein n=1 Tax=Hymenochirus boettgeri TaxID=247094 RepID=A0A8T2KHB9_9PIPI|nr:hypothetical protein GDO86_001492 [Hymenochirus boettgeri]
MDPASEDLPLMANTNHILVKHYALDVDICFYTKTIKGNIVLFFEHNHKSTDLAVENACSADPPKSCWNKKSPESIQADMSPVTSFLSNSGNSDVSVIGERDTSMKCDLHSNRKQGSGITSSEKCCGKGNQGSEDFVLVLDCCDLSVLKVEEMDVTTVSSNKKLKSSVQPSDKSKEHASQTDCILTEVEALPVSQWKDRLLYYTRCSKAPGCGDLKFVLDTWSLQISKSGIKLPSDFPTVIRIWYQTTIEGTSVKWTKDQSGRPCVYTFGSPINNRALFPCQEPPVAMSTWHATVQAEINFIVLMSGENCAAPKSSCDGFQSWFYYVSMPMPASTFTIAVGCWEEVRENHSMSTKAEDVHRPPFNNDCNRIRRQECKHMEYPCRFNIPEACIQIVIPYRVFAPQALLYQCSKVILPLIPQCLEAAHAVLGTHPFPRLDILIVPNNFSSLGMASPHIIYLSQSVLSGRNHLCATRICHEIAHAWFGLAIGACDWTEEWISEGFATHLEDVIFANVQKLPQPEVKEQQELKALLRWRRLTDEMKDSEEELKN